MKISCTAKQTEEVNTCPDEHDLLRATFEILFYFVKKLSWRTRISSLTKKQSNGVLKGYVSSQLKKNSVVTINASYLSKLKIILTCGQSHVRG